MSNSNSRFTFNNPPHWACEAVPDWQVYDEGQRISVDRLVDKANQQEQHIQRLLAEIQQLKSKAVQPVDFVPAGQRLTLSNN